MRSVLGVVTCGVWLLMVGLARSEEAVFDLSHLYDETETAKETVVPEDSFEDLLGFEMAEPVSVDPVVAADPFPEPVKEAEPEVFPAIEIPVIPPTPAETSVAPPAVASVPVPTGVQTRIQELEEIVVQRDRQIRELKQALEQMTTEFSQQILALRQGAGVEGVRELVERQTELEIVLHDLAQLREAYAALEKAHVELKSGYMAFQAQSAVADGQVADMQARLTESEGVILMLGSERDALQQRVGTLDRALATTLAETEEAVSLQTKRLEAQIQEKEAELATFEQRMASEKGAMQAELFAANGLIADLQARLKEADGVILMLGRERDALQQRVGELDQALVKTLAETDDVVKMQTQRLETILAAKQAELTAVKAQAQSEQESAVARLQAANMAARTAHEAEMMGRLRAMESEHAATLASMESQHKATLASMRSEHEAKWAVLQREFDDYRSATEKKLSVTEQLRSEVARLEAALQVARTHNLDERFTLSYNSGSIFLAAGHFDRAEEAFNKALSVREDDAALHYNMGVLYDEHLKQPAKARRHYERFLALAPNDRDAPMVQQWLRELR